MVLSSHITKSVYTIIFIAFAMIVVTHIPIHSLVNNPIFFEGRTEIFSLKEKPLSIFRSQGFIVSNIIGNPSYVYQQEEEKSALHKLYLGFDGNDYTNNYYTVKSSYELNNLQKVKGSYSAKFVSRNNGITFFPNSKNPLQDSTANFQSFTITFSLYPYGGGEATQTILEYIGASTNAYQLDKLYGIQITIEDGVINYHLHNFFIDSQGVHHSFTLREPNNLKSQVWERHTIVVDSVDRTIRIYRNNQEVATAIITETRQRTGEKLLLSPNLLEISSFTPINIGKNSIFSLDELIAYKDVVTNFMEYTPNQLAFFETDVQRLSDNYSWLHEMGVTATENTNMYYRLAYRFDKDYFLPGTSSSIMPWVFVDTKKKNFPSSKSLGRYIQWRLEYYTPSTPTQDLFYVQDIKTRYRENIYPSIINISTALSGDREVEISWDTLPNKDIVSYEIYYGNQPNYYYGQTEVSPPSPISIQNTPSSRSTKITYTLEGLQNETPYYISIRAKDIYGQYGPYSPEVLLRPSSINNEFGYSIGR